MDINRPYPLAEQVSLTDSALSFVRALYELERSDFDVLYFLDKPHKWQSDYELWLLKGAPTSDDHPAWYSWALAHLNASNAEPAS